LAAFLAHGWLRTGRYLKCALASLDGHKWPLAAFAGCRRRGCNFAWLWGTTGVSVTTEPSFEVVPSRGRVGCGVAWTGVERRSPRWDVFLADSRSFDLKKKKQARILICVFTLQAGLHLSLAAPYAKSSLASTLIDQTITTWGESSQCRENAQKWGFFELEPRQCKTNHGRLFPMTPARQPGHLHPNPRNHHVALRESFPAVISACTELR
jgi:hypothetical protein